ncbi:nuclear transport factor 2 family protein [Stenotrophomonas pictorum]|nr:nuclear transport factor 2 family protein [Stenotrophomonas pictorum]
MEKAKGDMARTAPNYLLCVLILLLLAACKAAPPEQRLRQTVAAMQEAVERGAPGDFMASVSADFVGNEGLDRAGLERLLKAQLLLNHRVTVQTGPVTVAMGDDMRTATVRFTVLMVGGSGRFLPERGEMQEVVSGWRDEDGRWQVYSASWKRAGEPEL